MTNTEPAQRFLRFLPLAWAHSNRIEAIVWPIACLLVIGLGTSSWRFSHKLDPYRHIVSKVEPIRIDGMALDWKWQSIYPDLGVATVSQIAFPVNVPESFNITARAASQGGFARCCLTIVRRSRKTLGRDEYKALAKASRKSPAEYFSTVMPDLFAAVLAVGVLGVA
jgi:COX Aromatic Rich Motif